MKDIFLTLFKFIKRNIIFIIIFAAYCLIMYFLDIPGCISKLIFGVPCPGCGMTRAFMSLITFHPIKAFMYNPFIYVLPFIMIIIIFKDYKIPSKLYKSNIFWIILLLLIIVTFIIRIIFMYPDEPFDLNQNSLLFIIINWIKQ